MKRPDAGLRVSVSASFPDLNGARMPSMAEELATERRTARSRCTGSRRWGLVVESFSPMPKSYQQLQRNGESFSESSR